MPRLVVFGDSYTFGDGLPDCYPVTPETKPSSYVWANLIANNLKYELLNLSKGGSSNLEILWKIMNTSFNDDDIVLVAWTPHHIRSHFFEFIDKTTTTTVGTENPRHKDIVLSLGDLSTGPKYNDLAHHKNYDITMKNYLIVQHGGLYLKNKKLNYFHIELGPKFTDIEIENTITILPWLVDLGLDNLHPGPKSHAFLAKIIYNKVNNVIH
jgi:hypothetical protein